MTARTQLSHFRRRKFLCWSLLLASGIIYGSSFCLMKIAASSGANPLGMVFCFAIFATMFLALGLTFGGRLGGLDLRLLGFCVPWGILSVIFPNLCFFYAARKIPASIIALGIALVPILTLAGTIVLRGEKLTPRRAAGIGLGAVAVMAILLPHVGLPDSDDTLFVMIAFVGAGCYAAEHLYIGACAPPNVSIDRLLFLMFASVSVLLLPIMVATGTLFVPEWPPGPAEAAMLAMAGVTLLDYFLITLLILWAGPVFASQAAYIVTVAGFCWGTIIFGDRHTIWLWAAVCILAVGLALVRPRQYERSPSDIL